MKRDRELEKRKIERLHRKGKSILFIANELNRSTSFIYIKIKEIEKEKAKVKKNEDMEIYRQ